MQYRRVGTRQLHYYISKGRFLLAVSKLPAWHQVIYNNGGSPQMTCNCQHVSEIKLTCMTGNLFPILFYWSGNWWYIDIAAYIPVLSIAVKYTSVLFNNICVLCMNKIFPRFTFSYCQIWYVITLHYNMTAWILAGNDIYFSICIYILVTENIIDNTSNPDVGAGNMLMTERK